MWPIAVKVSPREWEIIDLLLQGYSGQAMSKKLKMARSTLKHHMQHLFLRFQIPRGGSRTVKLAILLHRSRSQWIDLNERENLTVRERRFIELVTNGHTNREIASQLGTTEPFVKYKLNRIFDKLGVWSRLELALWYESRREMN